MTDPCPGCGARLPDEDGPTHLYMTASPACWRRYGLLLANDYADPAAWPSHRLAVDAYAVQHPGGDDRRAIQSVWMHLGRLSLTLGRDLTPEAANRLMTRLSAAKHGVPRLEPPASHPITVADVLPAIGTDGHHPAIRDWARSAWEAWGHAHADVRAFVAAALE